MVTFVSYHHSRGHGRLHFQKLIVGWYRSRARRYTLARTWGTPGQRCRWRQIVGVKVRAISQRRGNGCFGFGQGACFFSVVFSESWSGCCGARFFHHSRAKGTVFRRRREGRRRYFPHLQDGSYSVWSTSAGFCFLWRNKRDVGWDACRLGCVFVFVGYGGGAAFISARCGKVQGWPGDGGGVVQWANG